MREEIQQTLEKENLDRERSMAGEASEAGDTASGTVKSSAALLGDLEEIQTKIDRFKSRSLLTDHPAVKAYQEAVVSCYKFVHLCSAALMSHLAIQKQPNYVVGVLARGQPVQSLGSPSRTGTSLYFLHIIFG